jgi:hypothetical protein
LATFDYLIDISTVLRHEQAGLLWMLQYCWWAILGIAVVTAPLARWRGFFYSNPRSPFTEDKEQVVAWIKTNTRVYHF